VHRNIRPSAIGGESTCEAIIRSPKPASGNSAKVVAKTSRCSRQCKAPAKVAERDSRAPCKKNKSAIATDVRAPNTRAPAPLLSTFVSVAKAASFSEAGRRLGLRQSTVSQHIRRLEQAAGRRLFVRDTHSVSLTADGEAMLTLAQGNPRSQ
jgi:DNA-binding transcriptional ArsR family regulator